MGVVLLKRKLTSFQIIILGFSGVILFGTFLLMLPFSSRSGLATPFSDALFTSTSAVCVTGLIIIWRLSQQPQFPSESARLANGKYHRCPFGAVVSKCALTGEKRRRPPVSRRPPI